MVNRSAHIIVLAVTLLIALGIVMLISTCAFAADAAADGDLYAEVRLQLIYLGAGVVLCASMAAIDYHQWYRFRWALYGLAVFLLILCFVPLFAAPANGENRWISGKSFGLSFLRCQPSEFAKLVLALVLGAWFARNPNSGGRFLKGFALPLAIGSALILLVLLEVDMGTAAIMSAMCFAVLFVAGVDWKYLTGLSVAGLAAFAGLVASLPDRVERLAAFLDLESHRDGAGFQQVLSLMAFGSGGVDGLGMGMGRLKMAYMPFAHTDFIFPMVGEELGLGVTLGVVFCFVLIAVGGLVIAFHAPDSFGKLLALGIVIAIVMQAALNIGVTTAVLPNTGLPLPFVSYGGSNLVTGLIGIGILLNIYRQIDLHKPADLARVRRQRYTPRV